MYKGEREKTREREREREREIRKTGKTGKMTIVHTFESQIMMHPFPSEEITCSRLILFTSETGASCLLSLHRRFPVAQSHAMIL
jgi:hypothetical protein